MGKESNCDSLPAAGPPALDINSPHLLFLLPVLVFSPTTSQACRQAIAKGNSNAPAALQVLLIMAEELGKFIPYVGGPAHAHALLTPLEALSMVGARFPADAATEAPHSNVFAAETVSDSWWQRRLASSCEDGSSSSIEAHRVFSHASACAH